MGDGAAFARLAPPRCEPTMPAGPGVSDQDIKGLALTRDGISLALGEIDRHRGSFAAVEATGGQESTAATEHFAETVAGALWAAAE